MYGSTSAVCSKCSWLPFVCWDTLAADEVLELRSAFTANHIPTSITYGAFKFDNIRGKSFSLSAADTGLALTPALIPVNLIDVPTPQDWIQGITKCARLFYSFAYPFFLTGFSSQNGGISFCGTLTESQAMPTSTMPTTVLLAVKFLLGESLMAMREYLIFHCAGLQNMRYAVHTPGAFLFLPPPAVPDIVAPLLPPRLGWRLQEEVQSTEKEWPSLSDCV
jgi:hypothetical protein